MDRTITIMYDGSNYTLEWLRTLIWAKNEFKERDIDIEFEDGYNYELLHNNKIVFYPQSYEKIVKRWKSRQYDIVLLAYHDTGILGDSKRRAQLLPILKERSNCLIWLDTTDSSGTCNFDVLPYVDRYLKKQLLKDLTLYTRHFYGERLFVDYYKKKFQISDDFFDSEKKLPVLDKNYLDKIGLSWNRGLGDKFGLTKEEMSNFTDTLAPWNFYDVTRNKFYDVHYKVTIHKEAISFQRAKIKELLEKCAWVKRPNIEQKVPYDEYIKEFLMARSVISPFGWGEICYRDFDAFAYGIALIKPNMSHLVTFPNWYIDGETYISLQWDFSDFENIMHLVCSEKNRDMLFEIALNGQKIFKYMASSVEGKEQFVIHFLKQCRV